MPRQSGEDTHDTVPAFLRRSPHSEDLGMHLHRNGPVSYLAAESLERPLELPRSEMRRLFLIAGIAALLGIVALFVYNSMIYADQQKLTQSVEEVINRGVTLDLPSMQECAGRSNEDILGMFYGAGYPIFDNSSSEDQNVNGFDVYKLAYDVSVEEAAAAYEQGIDQVEPVEAARVLSGSWRFLVDRYGQTELRLRYIDFAATTASTAINDALASQGFDAAAASPPTEDSMGNTNVTGTFDKDGTVYNYTISVCDLSSVYDIEGLPASAQYVGVRVTSG